MASVEDRVKQVIAARLGADPEKLTGEARFVEDLGAESMQSIELVAAFEAEFDIEMDEDAALEVKTVGNAIAFISKAVEEQG